jgi:hypothetical protein
LAYLDTAPRLGLEGRPHIHKTAMLIFANLLLSNLLTLLTGQFDRLGLALNTFLASLVVSVATANSRALRGAVDEALVGWAGRNAAPFLDTSMLTSIDLRFSVAAAQRRQTADITLW